MKAREAQPTVKILYVANCLSAKALDYSVWRVAENFGVSPATVSRIE